MLSPDSDAVAAKTALRARLTAVRRARNAADRRAAAESNAVHLLAALAGVEVLCGYLPLASEPLAVDLLDRLAASGTRVLVPVVTADAPLDWCRHPGPSAPGAFGIAEPTGPRLGADAIRGAEVVLVPALAVDRTGARLGRGGGHYDRSLAVLGSSPTRLLAVLFDGERLHSVPTQRHDRPVDSTVTPTLGLSDIRR